MGRHLRSSRPATHRPIALASNSCRSQHFDHRKARVHRLVPNLRSERPGKEVLRWSDFVRSSAALLGCPETQRATELWNLPYRSELAPKLVLPRLCGLGKASGSSRGILALKKPAKTQIATIQARSVKACQ